MLVLWNLVGLVQVGGDEVFVCLFVWLPRFFEHPPNPLTFPNTIGYNIRRWGVAIYGERWRFVPDYEPNHTRAWLGTRDVARQTTPKVALWFSLRRAL